MYRIGLVWGEELYFDSTKVQANAAIDRLMPRVEWEAQHHLQKLFETEEKVAEEAASLEEDHRLVDQVETASEKPEVLNPQEVVEKYDGSRLTGVREPSYERLTDREVCPTDPDASPMHPSGEGSAALGYSDHYIVDGG